MHFYTYLHAFHRLINAFNWRKRQLNDDFNIKTETSEIFKRRLWVAQAETGDESPWAASKPPIDVNWFQRKFIQHPLVTLYTYVFHSRCESEWFIMIRLNVNRSEEFMRVKCWFFFVRIIIEIRQFIGLSTESVPLTQFSIWSSELTIFHSEILHEWIPIAVV